jgi:GT2 family glycosyltransferase
VVIVNYCQWQKTAALVRELRRSPCAGRGDVEIVVVDNHSPPHVLMRRLRRWPGVSLRRWGRNRGFAEAVNEGSRLSRGQWLLLLNPDVSTPPGFLDGVLNAADSLAERDPRTGIVGFRLRNSDGTRQLSSGPFPTLVQTLLRLALPRTRRKYDYVRARRPRSVPWVTGCCMLVKRACLEDLGGLDRDFFLYYEDVDLCRRAQSRGWVVAHDPGIQAVHHRPLQARPVRAYLRLLTRHALLTYAAKHWPAWQLRVLAGLIELECLFRRHRAQCKGQSAATRLFAQMRDIAADMRRGLFHAARQRLERVVRHHERERAA